MKQKQKPELFEYEEKISQMLSKDIRWNMLRRVRKIFGYLTLLSLIPFFIFNETFFQWTVPPILLFAGVYVFLVGQGDHIEQKLTKDSTGKAFLYGPRTHAYWWCTVAFGIIFFVLGILAVFYPIWK